MRPELPRTYMPRPSDDGRKIPPQLHDTSLSGATKKMQWYLLRVAVMFSVLLHSSDAQKVAKSDVCIYLCVYLALSFLVGTIRRHCTLSRYRRTSTAFIVYRVVELLTFLYLSIV